MARPGLLGGTSYGPGSSRQRPHDSGDPSSAPNRSEEGVRALARRDGISPTTVQKWRKRTFVTDQKMGPAEPRSTTLSLEQEAMIVTFRRHTLLPLDDCLYALQPTIPSLTRSSLHRCLQRHGISRLPDREGDKPAKRRFRAYPIGLLHMNIAEVGTGEGKLYLFPSSRAIRTPSSRARAAST